MKVKNNKILQEKVKMPKKDDKKKKKESEQSEEEEDESGSDAGSGTILFSGAKEMCDVFIP